MNLKELIKKWYIPPIKQYADFKSRTGKKAYWMFILFNFIFAWVVFGFDNILVTTDVGFSFWGIGNGSFSNFYSLILLIPGIAINIRRLHDVGEEGSKLFYIFIPIIGWIILFGLLIKEGAPLENKFGPAPSEDPIEQDKGGHPYTPNEGQSEEKFDVSVIRKQAEETIAKKEKTEKKKIASKAQKIKWGRDRGAIDFRTPPNKDGSRKS
ncbi:MAG: DUF805 domain-containing protein [Candidatus Marinimicrobia bacterium]|nr:DUF805 domain-containing protein [Candidatus Neomarinimicrobiota bacterium]